MKCGELVLVYFPFTDGSSAKLRPVLVVSSDEFNRGADIVVLPLSSRPDPSDPRSYYVDMSLPRFRSAGLRLSSSIKWSKPLTIDQNVVSRRLGYLETSALQEVQEKLCSVFS